MTKGFKYIVVSVSTILVGFLLMGALLGQSTESIAGDPYRHLNVFTEVFAKIKSDYVEEPNMGNVTLGAINGLLVSMDPFASYLNADQYKAWQQTKARSKADIGLVLSRKYGYEVGIVDAIPGSPAEKAGLATGDIIEAIDGISTRDMPLAYADVLLHGEPGSSVELTVLRLRKPEPTKIKMTRAVITVPAPTSKMLDTATGYVAIHDLRAGKVQEIATKIRDLEKQGAKSLVLDLRHCAVFVPEEGTALANLFMEKGSLGYLEGQKVAKQEFAADASKAIWKGPLVVLTNRGTAGAAEIAATALLETKRAEVVGERTYGDAAQRKAVMTDDGGAVLLAVAKYYGPNGKAIQDVSVTPSYAVADAESEYVDEDAEETPETPATPQAPPKPAEDLILKKAIEVLQGKAEAPQRASNAGPPTVLLPGEPAVSVPRTSRQ